MPASKGIVLFDLDGTIIDQRVTILKCLNQILKEHSASFTLDEITPLIGNPLKEVIKQKLNCDDKLAQRLRERYKKIYVKHYLENTKIYEGILELIKELKLKGVKLGIITSKYGSIAREFLKDLKIADLFDIVVGEGDTELKPSPAPVLYACELLKIDHKTCIVVGDNVNDVICGKSANSKTIAVLWGYGKKSDIMRAKPDYTTNSPEELGKIIQNIFSNRNNKI